MSNKFKHRIINLVISFSVALALCISSGWGALSCNPLISHAEELDVSTVGVNVSVPAHTHIYQYAYDDNQHWLQCIVCNALSGGKSNHSLHGNGGSQTRCSTYGTNIYREVCDCGYMGKPWLMIHGNTYNYSKYKGTNYGYGPGSFENCRQFTQSEYNTYFKTKTVNGHTTIFWDYKGTGYGIVLCGGYVIGDGNIIGTIEYFAGSEGDCGRKNRADEYYILQMYLLSDDTPTRSEFVTWIRNKINAKCGSNNTYKQRNLLYGYDTKYANLSDAQFNSIKAQFTGYSEYRGGYGWGNMTLQCPSHASSGNYYYGCPACYDCKVDMTRDYSHGTQTTCDICDLTNTNKESFTNGTWYVCNGGNQCKTNGSSYTCGGHVLYGEGNIKLGTVYCDFKRSGHTVQRRLRAIAESGGSTTCGNGSFTTWSGTTSNWHTLGTTDDNAARGYFYDGTVTFTKSGKSNRYSCGAYYILNDDTVPTTYGWGNSSYWSVGYNSSRTRIDLKVSFSDPDQYSLNVPYFRLFDSDQKTPIKTATGGTNYTMYRRSGTPGNAGGAAVWTGSTTVVAEVPSYKNIYVQCIDSTNNASALQPVQIQGVDAKGPTITVSATPDNMTSWSTHQTFTVTAKDDCSWSQLGLSNSDLKTVASSAGASGSRTWTIKGNITGTKNITFYAKDATGNVSYVTKTFGNIDNTAPKFTSQSVANVFSNIAGKSVATSWRIDCSHNDYWTGTTSGSGVVGLGITTNPDVAPTTYYTNLYNVSLKLGEAHGFHHSGHYWLWIKDGVGHVTRSDKITVHGDVKINGIEVNNATYNGQPLEYIEYNGQRLRL